LALSRLDRARRLCGSGSWLLWLMQTHWLSNVPYMHSETRVLPGAGPRPYMRVRVAVAGSARSLSPPVVHPQWKKATPPPHDGSQPQGSWRSFRLLDLKLMTPAGRRHGENGVEHEINCSTRNTRDVFDRRRLQSVVVAVRSVEQF
jgi:hypothetical protein